MNRRRTLAFGALVSLVLFAVMGLIVTKTTPWQAANNAAPATDGNDLQTVVDTLFGDDVIAFEILGILLTAAMIGALVIARPMDAVQDSTRYSHPTVEEVAESDRASDPKHAVMTGPSTVRAPTPSTEAAE